MPFGGSGGGCVSVKNFGAKGDGVTDDTVAVELAIASIAAGTILCFPAGTYILTGEVTATKAMTFHLGGAVLSWTTDENDQGLRSSVGNVAVIGGTLKGPQSTTEDTTQNGFAAEGADSSNYILDIRIEGTEIKDWGGSGIQLKYVSGFLVHGCYLHDIRKSGVLGLSVSNGAISDNYITDIHPSGSTSSGDNAYGIQLSKSDGTEATHPVSSYVTVSGNIVRNVITWTGLDTHGGTHLVFDGNVVEECKIGIAIGGYVATVGEQNAPDYCIVTGNSIKRTNAVVPDADVSQGIVITGALTDTTMGLGNVVTSNTIEGYGTTDVPASAAAAIECQYQDGLIVSDNVIVDSGTLAILIASCDNINVNGNAIRDLRGTSAAYASGVYTFTGQPAPGETITVNGKVFTFDTEITIGGDLETTLTNAETVLNADTDGRVLMATYTSDATTLTVTADTRGEGFNALFTLAEAVSNATVAAMSGGDTGNTAIYMANLSGGSSSTGIVSGNTFDIGTDVGCALDDNQTDMIFENNRHLGSGITYDFRGTTSQPQGAIGEIRDLAVTRVVTVIGTIGAGSTATFYVPMPGVGNASTLVTGRGQNRALTRCFFNIVPANNYLTVTIYNDAGSGLNLATTNWTFSTDHSTRGSAITVEVS
jgi:hypothetical protein